MSALWARAFVAAVARIVRNILFTDHAGVYSHFAEDPERATVTKGPGGHIQVNDTP